MLSPLEILLYILLAAPFVAPLIPMRRRSPSTAHFPVVTLCLVIVNILCYFATLSHNRPDPDILSKWGLIPHAASVITLITHLFLHGGLMHLVVNMIGLWVF